MQSYRTAQQAVKEVFERYPSISFEEAVKSYEEGEITTEDFLATSKMFLNCYNKMIAEVMEFFSSKTRRAKVLTVEELKEANPELTDEEMELMLKNQNSKEAKKAAKKAESEAKKAAKKAESDAKKAAKKAESDAKKAAKKAESDAKKAAKKIELSAARKQATEERKLMKAEDNNSRKSQVLETLAAKDDSSISSSDNESEISEENEVDKDDDSSESIEENEVKATEEVVKVDDNEEKEELAIVDEISDKNDLLAVVESIADELQSIELKKANLAVVELEKANLAVVELEKANLAVVELEKANLAVVELEKANLAMVELKTELNKVEQRVETTKVKKVSKPKIKVKEPEARHIVNHDGDVTTIHDTKTHMKYILREGKCFTENKLLGKWNPKQDSIEYFNLGQDEAKPITFTKVYDAEAETFFENKSAYITGDCIVYLNGDGEVWGRYDPSSNTIHAEEEEEDYDEEE